MGTTFANFVPKRDWLLLKTKNYDIFFFWLSMRTTHVFSHHHRSMTPSLVCRLTVALHTGVCATGVIQSASSGASGTASLKASRSSFFFMCTWCHRLWCTHSKFSFGVVDDFSLRLQGLDRFHSLTPCFFDSRAFLPMHESSLHSHPSCTSGRTLLK